MHSFKLLVTFLFLFQSFFIQAANVDAPQKTGAKTCKNTLNGSSETNPKAPSAKSKSSNFLNLRTLYKYAGVEVVSLKARKTDLPTEWNKWAKIARAQMRTPGVFDYKVTWQTAEFLKEHGVKKLDAPFGNFKPGDEFNVDNFFFHWLAAVPEPFVSFLSKSGKSAFDVHHNLNIRQVIWEKSETVLGQIEILGSLVEGLKRTFIKLEMDNEVYEDRTSLSLLFAQLQQSILDGFPTSNDRLLTGYETDYEAYGDAYSNYSESKYTPKSSTYQVHEAAEEHYGVLDVLDRYVSEAKSPSRSNQPNYVEMANDGRICKFGLALCSYYEVHKYKYERNLMYDHYHAIPGNKKSNLAEKEPNGAADVMKKIRKDYELVFSKVIEARHELQKVSDAWMRKSNYIVEVDQLSPEYIEQLLLRTSEVKLLIESLKKQLIEDYSENHFSVVRMDKVLEALDIINDKTNALYKNTNVDEFSPNIWRIKVYGRAMINNLLLINMTLKDFRSI